MLTAFRSRLSAWIGDAALKRIVKNASLLFGAETIVTLISLVQFPIVIRLLGAENYGAWGIAVSWVGLVSQVLAFRLWETVIKYLSQFMQDDEPRALAILKLCLLIDFVIGVITFVIVAATADLAAAFVLKSRPDGADLIRLEALNVFLGVSMSVWVAVLRTFGRFRFISVYNVLSAATIFAVWMAALSVGAGVGGLILVTALIKLGQTLALAVKAHRELAKKFSRHWLAADLQSLNVYRREIWVMLFSMNVDALRKIAVQNADLVVLGWLTTPTQAGVYRLAKQLSASFGRFTNPIYDSLYPEVARLYAVEGPAAVRVLVRRLMRGVISGLAVAIIAAYVLSPWAVPLVFGPEYWPAIPLFYLIVLTNLWAVGLWIPSVMVSAGRAKQLTMINVISSLVMLTTLLALVSLWGALGAAIALISFHVTWLALGYPAARRALASG